MNVVRVRIDQTIHIGPTIRVRPTDIDAHSIRIQCEGEYVGGPDDGAAFRFTREVSLGNTVEFGTLARLIFAGADESTARLQIIAPTHWQVGIQT